MTGRKTRVVPKGAYHHGDLRRQLTRAARRLVEERGAAAFKVAEACRLAGVSTAAPYKHFEDRDEILATVAAEGFAALARAMLAGLEGVEPGTPEAIDAIGHAYVGFATGRPHLFRLMFGPGLANEAVHPFVPDDEEPFDVLTGQVGLALGRAPDAMPVQRAALALWSFVHGMSHLLIDDKLGITAASVEGMIELAGRRVLPAFGEGG